MKVLSLGPMFFKLPDDFEGGFSDALRIFADYHESVTDKLEQSIGTPQATPPGITATTHEQRIWEEFVEMVRLGDRCVCGCAGITRYAGGGTPGVPLDLNTGAQSGETTEVEE